MNLFPFLFDHSYLNKNEYAGCEMFKINTDIQEISISEIKNIAIKKILSREDDINYSFHQIEEQKVLACYEGTYEENNCSFLFLVGPYLFIFKENLSKLPEYDSPEFKEFFGHLSMSPEQYQYALDTQEYLIQSSREKYSGFRLTEEGLILWSTDKWVKNNGLQERSIVLDKKIALTVLFHNFEVQKLNLNLDCIAKINWNSNDMKEIYTKYCLLEKKYIKAVFENINMKLNSKKYKPFYTIPEQLLAQKITGEYLKLYEYVKKNILSLTTSEVELESKMEELGFHKDFFIPEKYMRNLKINMNIDDPRSILFIDEYFPKFMRSIEEILTNNSLLSIIEYIEKHPLENKDDLYQNIMKYFFFQYLQNSQIFFYLLDYWKI